MIVLNTNGDELKELHDNTFPFPDLSDSMYISRKSVISEGRVIAGGLVKLTTEGVLFVNKFASLHQKSIASKAIIESLKQDLINKNIHECHTFVQSMNVCMFLSSLGFKYCKESNPMVIHF